MCLHSVVVGTPWQNKAFYFGWSDPRANLAPDPTFVRLEMPIIRNSVHCSWLREVHLPVTVNMRGVGFRALLSVGGGGEPVWKKGSLSHSISGTGGAGLPTKPNGPRHCGSSREFVYGLLSNPLQLMRLSKCWFLLAVGIQDGIVA